MKPTPLTDKFIEDFCDKIDITLFKKGKNLFDFIIEYQLFIEDSLYFFRKLRDEIHNAIQPSDGTFYVKYFRVKFKRCWALLADYHEWTEKHFIDYIQVISPGIDDSQAQRYKKEYQYCLDRSNEFFYYLSEYFEELKGAIGEVVESNAEENFKPARSPLKAWMHTDDLDEFIKMEEKLFVHGFIDSSFKWQKTQQLLLTFLDIIIIEKNLIKSSISSDFTELRRSFLPILAKRYGFDIGKLRASDKKHAQFNQRFVLHFIEKV